jgi:hypothetical protein
MTEKIGRERNDLAQICPPEEIEIEGLRFGFILEADPVGRLANTDQGGRWIVEEESVSKVRKKQRNGDVAARSMVNVAVPKTARGSKPIQGLAAMAEAVAMLVAENLEPKP